MLDKFIKEAKNYYESLKKDNNHRFYSWENCYSCFYLARHNKNEDYDYLSLKLAFYLASWGMYRGSSFILQKDYKIHIPIVKEILDKKYDVLFGIDCSVLKKENNLNLLFELINSIKKYYEHVRSEITNNQIQSDISDTLVTKVLLGTLGCVPAYDDNFVKAIRYYKVATGTFKNKSINELINFYNVNYQELEEARKEMKIGVLPYPQMKLLDMGFWMIGLELNKNKD